MVLMSLLMILAGFPAGGSGDGRSSDNGAVAPAAACFFHLLPLHLSRGGEVDESARESPEPVKLDAAPVLADSVDVVRGQEPQHGVARLQECEN